jgi:large subunit ribosomal protein L32
MPVPKRKASKCRRNSRKSANQVVSASSFMDCKNCGNTAMPHQVCKNCGFYGGKKVMETKLDRAMRRGKASKEATADKSVQPVDVSVEPDVNKITIPKKGKSKKD